MISSRFYHARQTCDNEERFWEISGCATAQSSGEEPVIVGRRMLPLTPTVHLRRVEAWKDKTRPGLGVWEAHWYRNGWPHEPNTVLDKSIGI